MSSNYPIINRTINNELPALLSLIAGFTVGWSAEHRCNLAAARLAKAIGDEYFRLKEEVRASDFDPAICDMYDMWIEWNDTHNYRRILVDLSGTRCICLDEDIVEAVTIQEIEAAENYPSLFNEFMMLG